jgi:hypothetical protein
MLRTRWVPAMLAIVLCLANGVVEAQSQPAADSEESQLVVAKHRFGLAIIDREIQDEIDAFYKDEIVYLWMQVEGGPGDPLLVTWSIGDFSYDVQLGIGGSPWRTWARKTLFRSGEWTVLVTDAAGNELLKQSLMVAEGSRP